VAEPGREETYVPQLERAGYRLAALPDAKTGVIEEILER
jgi:hypothetical protein